MMIWDCLHVFKLNYQGFEITLSFFLLDRILIVLLQSSLPFVASSFLCFGVVEVIMYRVQAFVASF